MSAAAAELRTAAQKLLDYADAAQEDLDTNPYWRSAVEPPERWFANGIDNAVGGAAGELAAVFSPDVARNLAAVFRAWARMVDMDSDLLHRVGGAETLAVARAIGGGAP